MEEGEEVGERVEVQSKYGDLRLMGAEVFSAMVQK